MREVRTALIYTLVRGGLCSSIGLAGQSALLQALEASHGMDMKNLSSVVFNAPFYLPAFLTRAQSRGWRRFFEAGVL